MENFSRPDDDRPSPSSSSGLQDNLMLAGLHEHVRAHGQERASGHVHGHGEKDDDGRSQNNGHPRHGFPKGKDGWGPPSNEHWGWQNHERWERGWDDWFWKNDPNYKIWTPNITKEAKAIARELDNGQTVDAVIHLREDLYALRGDMYAQDDLLNATNSYDRKHRGADLHLGNWDPAKGTWDNMEIRAPNGDKYPIQTYGNYIDPY